MALRADAQKHFVLSATSLSERGDQFLGRTTLTTRRDHEHVHEMWSDRGAVQLR